MKGFQDVYISNILDMKTFSGREYIPTEAPPEQGFPFWMLAIPFFAVAAILLGKGVIDLLYDKYYKGSIGLKGLI